MKRNIYLATSWRNPYFDMVLNYLLHQGHAVYNFKNPGAGKKPFNWSSVDQDWVSWSMEQYRTALDHPAAISGFVNDYYAMDKATECLLLLPSGRSSHIEAGYMAGDGKHVVALMFEPQEPELMYACLNNILIGNDEFESYYKA